MCGLSVEPSDDKQVCFRSAIRDQDAFGADFCKSYQSTHWK